MVASVGRLAATVERLLDLARAEAGTVRPGETCDVVRVLRLLVAEAPAEQVLLDDGDVEEMAVTADTDSVALLLGNLLRNAREHGTGPVRVTLGPGATVAIANPVAPGAAFLVGRFATGAGSRGSGLGLAIARATANRFGWCLSLAIADGGATARVAFDAP